MFQWLKNIFSNNNAPTLERPIVTPTVDATPKSGPTRKKSANTGRKASGGKKGPKKTGVTKTDLNKMSKDQLEKYAKKEFKVDIDKRRKKADLVEEVLKLAKKNG